MVRVCSGRLRKTEGLEGGVSTVQDSVPVEAAIRQAIQFHEMREVSRGQLGRLFAGFGADALHRAAPTHHTLWIRDGWDVSVPEAGGETCKFPVARIVRPLA